MHEAYLVSIYLPNKKKKKANQTKPANQAAAEGKTAARTRSNVEH